MPGIVVGLSGPVEDDGEKRVLPVALALIVCAAGSVLPREGISPDPEAGFMICLTWATGSFMRCATPEEIGDGLVLDDLKISFEPDNESLGDVWLGSVTFMLCASPGPRRARRELL